MSWPLGVVPTRRNQARYLGDVEASLVLLGRWDDAALRHWCPRVPVEAFEPWARYGPLVGRQLDRAVRLLRQDPSSRRALLVLARTTGVPPCNTVVQLLLRGGSLDVLVTVRSCDVARGLPYDVRTWSIVGAVVARTLGVTRGQLVVFAGSLHVYAADLPVHGSGYRVLDPVPPLPEARERAQGFVAGRDPWLSWSHLDEGERS